MKQIYKTKIYTTFRTLCHAEMRKFNERDTLWNSKRTTSNGCAAVVVHEWERTTSAHNLNAQPQKAVIQEEPTLIQEEHSVSQ